MLELHLGLSEGGRFLGSTPKILKHIQPGFSGAHEVDVSVGIHVNRRHLKACASTAFGEIFQSPAVFGVFGGVDGRVAAEDRVLDPFCCGTVKLVVKDHRGIGVAGFYFVRVDSFSGNEFRFALAIQIAKYQRVNLRECVVDIEFCPFSLAV